MRLITLSNTRILNHPMALVATHFDKIPGSGTGPRIHTVPVPGSGKTCSLQSRIHSLNLFLKDKRPRLNRVLGRLLIGFPQALITEETSFV